MNPLIAELAKFLASNGQGTLGTDLFIEELPADPADALVIMANISPPPDFYLATQTLDFEVWSRNKSKKTGNDKLTSLFLFLHRFHHVTLGDYYIYFIGALGNIEPLTPDGEGRSLHKINFRAIYIDNRTVS